MADIILSNAVHCENENAFEGMFGEFIDEPDTILKSSKEGIGESPNY